MTTPTVACPCCRGAGRIELTGELLLAYAALLSHPDSHASALAPALGCTPSACHNRLVTLEAKGLAVSRRWGKRRLYSVVAPPAEAA
jgi:DNA-binding MarR family transcriptional regulator